MSRPQHPIEVRRRAGVLLHPTSLPGGSGAGNLGHAAFHFIDFMADCGLSVWQVLPLGPTHEDRSPYQTTSVHAGSPELISLDLLQEWGWLEMPPAPDPADPDAWHLECLRRARSRFQRHASAADQAALREFIDSHAAWLPDFACYQAIKDTRDGEAWVDWPAPLRDREPQALEAFRAGHGEAIEQVMFEQFVFFRQWHDLRRYANERDILLFGDIPIFVAHDSADVWANREGFLLQEDGHPQVVAGVPPDYFSETGQRWGNPLYDWEQMSRSGYSWWWERIHTQRDLFDLIRIDHFRGFEAYWEIPAAAETAIAGRWVKGPGAAFFEQMLTRFGDLPLVAEDLGTIDEAVEQLRDAFHLPGMKILQFAFGSGADNPYLPHNHVPLSLVYTGTHDNDTTLGWYQSLDAAAREHLVAYLGQEATDMPRALNRTAMASVAWLSVVPLQDWLGLDGSHRMNQPGVRGGNWQWRFEWDWIDADLPGRIRELLELYGRA
ncbi:4-alpha-glucanotransferase [Thiohalobacter thiocyanaticus]|uniref:4-alpha-glucanotransferase n=1 Tax=Thiohalobacter thiocyanaticus TaxID=585455 RepID=A0A426QGJ5_9GAMM|nr:4-alpha-glucanotransferase [Thiohalobacter thiocyanaticus]RRQ20872.1 4-alpha-glucanotransferase [Thiohalobacter thiocyanaticus]